MDSTYRPLCMSAFTVSAFREKSSGGESFEVSTFFSKDFPGKFLDATLVTHFCSNKFLDATLVMHFCSNKFLDATLVTCFCTSLLTYARSAPIKQGDRRPDAGICLPVHERIMKRLTSPLPYAPFRLSCARCSHRVFCPYGRQRHSSLPA